MKFRLFTVGIFSLAQMALACPDYGVELGMGETPFKGIPVSVSAGTGIHLNLDKGLHSIYWEGGTKGKWCYFSPQAEKPTCYENVKGNEVVELNDGVGNKKLELVIYQRTNKPLAGTQMAGAFAALFVVENDERQMPWLRFSYNAESKPTRVDTNNLDVLIETLQKKGLSNAEIEKNTLTHRMYVDMFQNTGSGFIDVWEVLGSLTLEKQEVPFAPIPRGESKAEEGKANISKGIYRSKPGQDGCHTEVEEVKPQR